MNQLDLFAGIGGISLAAEWAGIETVAFCEKEPFAQDLLRRRFPGRPIYPDIYDLTKEVLENDGIKRIDIVAGGFPCQPFSHAGKRTGTADDRYLWPEMCRIIDELRPSWVFAENVDGLVSMAQSDSEIVMEDETTLCEEAEMVVETIRKDLEAIGYRSIPVVVPACGIGAMHRRYRIFIVAYSDNGFSQSTDEEIRARRITAGNGCNLVAYTSEPGLPKRRHSGFTESDQETGARLDAESERCSQDVADSESKQNRRSEQSGVQSHFGANGKNVADSSSAGLEGSTRQSLCRGGDGSASGGALGYNDSVDLQRERPLRIDPMARRSPTGEHQGSSDGAGQQGTAESGLGRDFDEFPPRMDGGGLIERKNETRSDQILSELRDKNGTEEIQRQTRRNGDLPQTEILRSDMYRRSEPKRESEFVGSEEEGNQIPQGRMRDVLHNEGLTGSSSGREPCEQRAGEYHDAVRIMSHEMALGARKDDPEVGELYPIADWLDGWGMNPLDALVNFIASYPQPAPMGMEQWDWEPPRVATGVKNRTSRLKALGNAVDPLQALPVLYGIRILHEHLKS